MVLFFVLFLIAVSAQISCASITMVYIPESTFMMGVPGDIGDSPLHRVTLSAYYIGKYEVTRGQYQQFIGAGGYSKKKYWSTKGWNWKVKNNRRQPNYWAARQNWKNKTFIQTNNHPVVGVSYYEAEAFCKWAGGTLPTEAQWERAAAYNAKTQQNNLYPWGDDFDPLKCNNWEDRSSAGGGYEAYQTSAVGSYPRDKSACGCYDMAGNVWEWCKDWYSEDYYWQSPAIDPQGAYSGYWHVIRGANWYWFDDSEDLPATNHRNYYDLDPNIYDIYGGFRLARNTVKPDEETWN